MSTRKLIAPASFALAALYAACGGSTTGETVTAAAGGTPQDGGAGDTAAAWAGAAGTDSSAGMGGALPDGATAGTGGTGDACIPGQQISCACLGGSAGIQSCKQDGTGYEPCGCPDASASGGSGGSPMACVPGQQILCACPGGAQSVQVCKQDGSGYEPCGCPDGGPGCVPGQQINCPCPGSVQGVQACKQDGSGYDACQCLEGGVGGFGGSTGCVLDCAGTQPAAMVQLPQGYSIDSTEVTRCQYKAWLDTNPSSAGQSAACSWNVEFAPNDGCIGGNADVYWGPGCGDHPQVCVDWCDAYAYCKAMGKRLCGKIGGGPASSSDYATASKSQWHNACVSAGTGNAYPYGNTYGPQACNGIDMHFMTTVPVGSFAGCQSQISGFAGVYDLSGNVWEWEDACEGVNPSQCHIRGGFFVGDKAMLRCDSNISYGVMDAGGGPNVGFRCCSNP